MQLCLIDKNPSLPVECCKQTLQLLAMEITSSFWREGV